MKRERTTLRVLRGRLLARTSVLALRRGWASGMLAAGLIATPATTLAQEIIDLATDAEVVVQGAAPVDFSGASVSGRATSTATVLTI